MINNTRHETWMPVPGHEQYYEISDQGRVRSKGRWISTPGKPYFRPGKVLKQAISPNNRPFVGLWVNGRSRVGYIHRLVLEAFVGPCPKGCEACHNDGDTFNNHLSNLRWDTRKNNFADKKKHGTWQGRSSHPRARLSEEQVRAIRESTGQVSGAEWARRLGVANTTISAVRRGQNWKPEHTSTTAPGTSARADTESS